MAHFEIHPARLLANSQFSTLVKKENTFSRDIKAAPTNHFSAQENNCRCDLCAEILVRGCLHCSDRLGPLQL